MDATFGGIVGGVSEVASQAGDLSDQGVAQKTIKLASERFGRGIIKPFSEHTPETLKTTIDRNLWTVLWCSWYAVPTMRKQGYGRIINLGADSVRNGLWDHSAQALTVMKSGACG